MTAAQRKALLDRLCEAAIERGEAQEVVSRMEPDGDAPEVVNARLRDQRAGGRLSGLRVAAEIVLVGDDTDGVPF